jgi:hypothetical protein
VPPTPIDHEEVVEGVLGELYRGGQATEAGTYDEDTHVAGKAHALRLGTN